MFIINICFYQEVVPKQWEMDSVLEHGQVGLRMFVLGMLSVKFVREPSSKPLLTFRSRALIIG